MKSPESRFIENKKEVIEYTRLFGNHSAMAKYDVRDYIAFKRFVTEATGNPTFGDSPVVNSSNAITAENLVDAFTYKVRKMEDENKRLQEELEKVTEELKYYKAHNTEKIELKVAEVLDMCKEKPNKKTLVSELR